MRFILCLLGLVLLFVNTGCILVPGGRGGGGDEGRGGGEHHEEHGDHDGDHH